MYKALEGDDAALQLSKKKKKKKKEVELENPLLGVKVLVSMTNLAR